MNTIKYIFTTVVFFILFVGCQSKDDSTSNSKDYQFKSGYSKKFTLTNDENLIVGRGCTAIELYDINYNQIANTNLFSYNLPENFNAGEYTIMFKELYGKYNDSIGVLYYLSSGYNIDDINFGQKYDINTRTATLYKVNFIETSSITISSYHSVIEIYDSNLNLIGSTNGFSNNFISGVQTLNSGTYYFLSSPERCYYTDGTFSINKL